MANKTGNIAHTVWQLLSPTAEQCGVYIWDVEYLRESGSYVLRVTIDREGGIDSDTCYHFTELANPILDSEDPIPESYMFEVSSPGLGRRLRLQAHFDAFVGSEVEIRTIRPIDGKRDFKGILNGMTDGVITLTTDGVQAVFESKDVAYTKLCDDIF